MFNNEDGEEAHGAIGRDNEDAFFDDESTEVVVFSLRLGRKQNGVMLRETMFTNTNWFSLQDDKRTNWSVLTSLVSSSPRVEDGQANNVRTSTNTCGNSSSNDEIVLKDDGKLADTPTSTKGFSNGVDIEAKPESTLNSDLSLELEKIDISNNLTFPQYVERSINIFSVKSPDWVEWENAVDFEGISGRNPFTENNPFEMDIGNPSEAGVNLKSACIGQDSRIKMDHVTGKGTIQDSFVPELWGEA